MLALERSLRGDPSAWWWVLLAVMLCCAIVLNSIWLRMSVP
jgi:hypothetical protein